MGRRGNPHDNAEAESVMTMLNVQATYPMACGTFDDGAANFARVIEAACHHTRPHPALGYLSRVPFEEQRAWRPAKAAA